MKYKSAYIIACSISVALLLSTIFGTYKIIYNSWLISTLENEKARIISCKSKHYSSHAGNSFNEIKYTPIASSRSGKKIYGNVFLSYDSCKNTVGMEVTVLIDDSSPNGGYINSFTQFWLANIALVIGTLLFNLVFVIPVIIVVKKM